jgi:hypothetical protein
MQRPDNCGRIGTERSSGVASTAHRLLLIETAQIVFLAAITCIVHLIEVIDARKQPIILVLGLRKRIFIRALQEGQLLLGCRHEAAATE